jgi:hypothetical protein
MGPIASSPIGSVDVVPSLKKSHGPLPIQPEIRQVTNIDCTIIALLRCYFYGNIDSSNV